ncbi:hepatic and glial cell adhesion molecule-like isoform X1 [Heptranchias perlo]|uniref:hepatic and glial cell adhesion molecule-like isoform X1 n=1 Tax=Heptranchias perlo TaxID=212740 RepID=UPI003559CC62
MPCVVRVVMFKLCLLLFKDQIMAQKQQPKTERINATIGGSVLFSTNCTSCMNRSIEWKYENGPIRTSIVMFTFGVREHTIFQGYKDRVDFFENGSILLSDVQLNDTGCYKVTLVDAEGNEVTVIKTLSVFESDISDHNDKQSNKGANMTEGIVDNRWKVVCGTVAGVIVVGIGVAVVYFRRRRQEESTRAGVPNVKSNEDLNSNAPVVVYSTYVGTFANYGKSRQTNPLDQT